uniref:Uncharacterized protein n=1 Tax=Rhizophora mucronata TaxID=61149 RepID=A0A2P2J700_RHIMU
MKDLPSEEKKTKAYLSVYSFPRGSNLSNDQRSHISLNVPQTPAQNFDGFSRDMNSHLRLSGRRRRRRWRHLRFSKSNPSDYTNSKHYPSKYIIFEVASFLLL